FQTGAAASSQRCRAFDACNSRACAKKTRCHRRYRRRLERTPIITMTADERHMPMVESDVVELQNHCQGKYRNPERHRQKIAERHRTEYRERFCRIDARLAQLAEIDHAKEIRNGRSQYNGDQKIPRHIADE